MLGPAATELCNHRKPFSKLEQRLNSIGETSFSYCPAIMAYNRDAMPTVGYVAQLVDYPRELRDKQFKHIAKVSCFPHLALGKAASLLQESGIVSLTHIREPGTKFGIVFSE